MKTPLLVVLAVLAGGCMARTVVVPGHEPRPPDKFVPDTSCRVRDYQAATEVPEGSRNLGWVSVPQQETDDATFEALRKKICGLGGNALSQPHWKRDDNAEQKVLLEANAWELP